MQIRFKWKNYGSKNKTKIKNFKKIYQPNEWVHISLHFQIKNELLEFH